MQCLGCHSAETSPAGVMVSEFYPLLQCKACGLRVLDVSHDGKDEPFDDYWGDVNERIYSLPTVVGELNAKYNRFLEPVRLMTPNPRMLDVGSGIGLCVEQAGRLGFDAVGVEPSKRAVEIAGRQRDVQIECGLLTRDDRLPKDNGLITLWDVIEHVPDPEYLLMACAEHLADDGVLVLETPDEGVLARKLVWALHRLSCGNSRMLSRIYYRAHRQYFTRGAMLALLTRCGFSGVTFHSEYTMFGKALEKLRLHHHVSPLKIRIYEAVFATMKRLPFLANKMVVVCTRQSGTAS